MVAHGSSKVKLQHCEKNRLCVCVERLYLALFFLAFHQNFSSVSRWECRLVGVFSDFIAREIQLIQRISIVGERLFG